ALVAINNSILVNVLANDTASTGQTLSASTVSIAQAPAHGAATINSATGAITYKPVSGFSGTDSFQYNVQDNLSAQSNTATVTVTIQPAPVAVNDTATLQANSSVMIAVLSNDTSSGGTLNTASIAIAVAPTHGTTVVSNGEVTYTPATGYSGLDTFQYSVKDNLGTPSNVATVSINVTPPPSSGGGGGSLSFPDILALIGLALLGSTGARSTARVHLKINR
ncbi:MAG TPA: Ig-like domain-containing protein, partial [Steroidobacteraceae bacterium]|nr:Ig-like domain-containing protein [Steroidobacteraceae bacterium]